MPLSFTPPPLPAFEPRHFCLNEPLCIEGRVCRYEALYYPPDEPIRLPRPPATRPAQE